MDSTLINLKDKLKKTDFKFEASSSVYNPMERFAEYVSTKEIIHSKIISDLLNPKGEHQLGYGFLVMFLQTIGIGVKTKTSPSAENPLHEVLVKTESFAPTDDSNGRIDILVSFNYNGKLYAIIIENKLNDAPDQPRQLARYNEYLNNLGYNESERITVYIPRIGTECKDYPTAKVINATMLAKIIDETLEESISPNKAAIQSYSNYLKNISMSYIIMENAKKLAGLSAEDIQNAKAIKEAYDKLPQAFAEELHKTYEKKGYESQIAPNYPNYCYIWVKESYSKTHLWLAVGFSHEACYFYIVSNDKNTYANYTTILNVAQTSTSYGDIWLKPINERLSYVSFKAIPDSETEKLSQIINYWLEELDKITLRKEQ